MFVPDDSEQEKYNYLHTFKMAALRIVLCTVSVLFTEHTTARGRL
jgi:hypothetical protein